MLSLESYDLYRTFKMLHLIAMVTWFAGIFYLPRLFVYHAMSDDDVSNQRFKTMERKLYRGIMVPSEIAIVVFGGAMLLFPFADAFWSMGWLHTKLSLVAILIAYQHYCGYLMKQFSLDANTHSHKFYRFLNEVPTIILLVIIYLAVFKPF